MSTQLNRSTRNFAAIYERDKNICQYCLSPAEAIDHIIPWSKGGDNEADNLVASCKKCNSTAKDKLFYDFVEKKNYILDRRLKKELGIVWTPGINPEAARELRSDVYNSEPEEPVKWEEPTVEEDNSKKQYCEHCSRILTNLRHGQKFCRKAEGQKNCCKDMHWSNSLGFQLKRIEERLGALEEDGK